MRADLWLKDFDAVGKERRQVLKLGIPSSYLGQRRWPMFWLFSHPSMWSGPAVNLIARPV